MAEPLGCLATVLTRIPGGPRPGSVRLLFHGAVDTWLAYAEEAHEPDSAVLVYNIRPGRAVDVMAAPPGSQEPTRPAEGE